MIPNYFFLKYGISRNLVVHDWSTEQTSIQRYEYKIVIWYSYRWILEHVIIFHPGHMIMISWSNTWGKYCIRA